MVDRIADERMGRARGEARLTVWQRLRHSLERRESPYEQLLLAGCRGSSEHRNHFIHSKLLYCYS